MAAYLRKFLCFSAGIVAIRVCSRVPVSYNEFIKIRYFGVLRHTEIGSDTSTGFVQLYVLLLPGFDSQIDQQLGEPSRAN